MERTNHYNRTAQGIQASPLISGCVKIKWVRHSERGALAPRWGTKRVWTSIGGLTPPRSLSHLPARLRNAENTHKFFTHP